MVPRKSPRVINLEQLLNGETADGSAVCRTGRIALSNAAVIGTPGGVEY